MSSVPHPAAAAGPGAPPKPPPSPPANFPLRPARWGAGPHLEKPEIKGGGGKEKRRGRGWSTFSEWPRGVHPGARAGAAGRRPAGVHSGCAPRRTRAGRGREAAAGTPRHAFHTAEPAAPAPRRLFPPSEERGKAAAHGGARVFSAKTRHRNFFLQPRRRAPTEGFSLPLRMVSFLSVFSITVFWWCVFFFFSCPLSTAAPFWGDPPPAFSAPHPDTSPSLHLGARQGGERARPRTHTHTHARTRLAATQPRSATHSDTQSWGRKAGGGGSSLPLRDLGFACLRRDILKANS